MSHTLKICLLFFLICIFLLCNNSPKEIQINFIAGILQDKLVFYAIFIGLIYTVYCQCKYKNVFINFDKFLKFTIVFLGWICVSLIIGLYTYPYYDLVLNGPVTQIEKLPKVINTLSNYEIFIDEKILTIIWMIQGRIKGALLEVLYTFGGAYMIYCWYHNNWRTALKILIKAVLVSLIVVFGYCFIELFYLAGSEIAESILITITPYFHIVKSDGTWWPPLLLKGQVRSIFAEPSYYGIYFAFAMPFLWYVFIKAKERCYKLISFSAII